MDFKSLRSRPLKLKYARIRRNYSGGLLLEEWQNNPDAADGNWPEEWVASTVEARDTNSAVNEGLSLVDSGENSGLFLRDVIKSDPAGFLGEDHAKKYHTDTAVLVKIIDSCRRLFLQVHPDRDFAKTVFNSDFGKTEAWYILGGRSVEGREPYILLGFKKGITKEVWTQLFKKQDVEGMINALHRFPIKPGDIFFIESGMPHALGAGCFLLEVQEPTDLTFRVERTTPEGKMLPDSFCHQGAGFEKMLDCFHYDTYTREEILSKWHLKPTILETQEGGVRTSLISSEYSPYFSMEKLEVTETFRSKEESALRVAVVLSGQGKLLWDNHEMAIKQADELFLPAGLKDILWQSENKSKLEVVICHPPK